MNIYQKNLGSIFALIIFLFIAMASQLEVPFSYTPEDCSLDYDVSYTPQLSVTLQDTFNKIPVTDAQVYVAVSYFQGLVVDDTPPCQKRYNRGEFKYLSPNQNGNIQHTFKTYLFRNKIDQVQIKIEVDSDGYEYKKTILVRNHQYTHDINLTFIMLPRDQL